MLTRMRHPGVLKVIEPLMEDNKNLVFVTEKVEYCVGDILSKPTDMSKVLSDIDCRLGVLDLIQALNFIHSEARLVHFGICP